ncbi:MAG: Ig-like domain-containing protein [Bacilli bacterium]|jgi:beta-lactamase superfamily II metal-dependent hydrolase/uncharacterized protein YjdB
MGTVNRVKKQALIASITSTMVIGLALTLINYNNINLVKGIDDNDWDTACVLPAGYDSIASIADEGVEGTAYTTRGTITSFEDKSFFIQSRGRGLMIYSVSSLGSFSLGNVVDVTGTYTIYNGTNELTSPTVTLYSASNPNPIIKEDLSESAYNLIDEDYNGRYVGLSGITIESRSSNNLTMTYGESTIYGYVAYTTTRASVLTAIDEYIGTSLDFSGIVTRYKTAYYDYYQLRTPTISVFNEHTSSPIKYVSSIDVSPSNTSIYTTEDQQFTASVLPSDATDSSITWTSTGGSISAAGLFSSTSEGDFTITATANDGSGVYGTATIHVVEPIVLVSSISVSPSSIEIDTEGTQQFTASVQPNNATDKTVVWSSSGGTITSAGVFSSSTTGTFTITATANDGSGIYGTASITVTEHQEASTGTVIDNPAQNGSVLGPMYVPGTLDQLSVNYQEMISSKYGDSILIDYGNFEILIDGGESSDKNNVWAALKNKCEDHVLEMLIVTHPHSDHLGALLDYSGFTTNSEVTSIKYIVDFGCISNYTNYVAFRNNWTSATYYPIYQMIYNESSGYPNVFNITSSVAITFLNTNNYIDTDGSAPSDENKCSIAFELSCGNYRYFLGGDCESSCETGLISNYSGTSLWSESTINIVKANHHGSSRSNLANFLAMMKPDYFIVSAAITSGNRTSSRVSEQHPYTNAIVRASVYTSQIYWNGINGTISTIHNANFTTMTMNFATRTLDYYYDGAIVDRESERSTTYLNSKFYAQIA